MAPAPTQPETAPETRRAAVSRRWLAWGWLSCWLAGVYFVIVSPVDQQLPWLNRVDIASALLGLSFAGTYVLFRKLHTRSPQILTAERLQNLTLLSSAALLSFLAIDIGYAIHSNLHKPQVTGPDLQLRQAEGYFSELEVFPRAYYPTEANFQVYKPNFQIAADTFGGFYYPDMLKSPLLASQVLKAPRISVVIDQHGFRESHRPEDAAVFALGDSFCFGQHIDTESGWVEVLHSRLRQTVYNLGVCGSSPRQQYLLLQYLLQKHPGIFRPKRLLWMIFEGNDLEDDYGLERPRLAQSTLTTALSGTLLENITSTPGQLRRASVIRRVAGRQFSFKARSMTGQSDPYELGGRRLRHPLYHSARFGHRLFEPTYMNRAAMPESYVANHPNRPHLEQTFRDMHELSRRSGFEVTILIAPTAARLYGPYFKGFPEISAKPYFISFVERLSRSVGFEVLNLYELLQPAASSELLYHRDDTHWNTEGNAAVARIVASHVFQR